MEFKKSLLALGVFAVLSGCGSSNDDKKEAPKSDLPDPAVTSDIKGVASKGTFINAPVYFYKYVDGAPVRLTEEELGAASTMTDDKGQYSAQVKVEGLVKVEIGVSQDINSPTFMICDAPAGCGQNAKGEAITFGEQMNMTVKDPTFTLTSLISAAKNDDDVQNTANITPLTHFAAALAEQRGDVSAESISKAQSEIADTFGLIGALNELVPAKVEDQESLVDDDETDNLRYALINAGIAQTLFAGSKGDVGDMSARLDSAIADMIAADGAFLVSSEHDDDDAFELTLEDILKGAEQATQQIIVLIKKDPVLAKSLSSIADFELLVTKLNNEVAKKKADAGEDGRSKGKETDTTEGDAVAKAAAMVNDVRVFANLFDVANTSGKEVQTQGEEFVQLVEDASIMVEEQADSFKLLSDVSEALAVIDSLRRAEQITEKTVQLDNYLATLGATGVVTLDEDGLMFNVQASAGAESLSANATITTNDTSTEYMLKIDGIIENDAAKFTLNEGTQVSVSLNKAVTEDELKSETFDLEAHGIEAVKGALNLELTLAQKKTDAVTNPVSFNGKLSAELVPVIVESLENNLFSEWSDLDNVIFYDVIPETSILPKMLYLGGSFSSDSGSQVAASFTVNVANAEGYQAAGFSYVGEKVSDIAILRYTSENNAVITYNEDETYGINLLSNGEDGTIVYENITSDYKFTGWLTVHNGIDHKIARTTIETDDPDSVTNWVRRLVFKDYSYIYQWSSVVGDIESFLNGVIKLKDGTSFNVDNLDWQDTQYRSYDLGPLRNYIGTASDINAVSDLHSFLNQPEFKVRNTLIIEGKGSINPIIPDEMPTVGETVSLDGRYISKKVEDTYEITVNEVGSKVVGALDNYTHSFSFNRSEDNSFVYTDAREYVDEYRITSTVQLIALNDLPAGKPYIMFTDYEYENLSTEFDDLGVNPPDPVPVVGERGFYYLPVVSGDTTEFYIYEVDSIMISDGVLTDIDANPIEPYEAGYFAGSAPSLSEALNLVSYGNIPFGTEYPAIEGFKISVASNQSFRIYGKGVFKVYDDKEVVDGNEVSEFSTLKPGDIITADTVLTYPEDTFELEDEDNFLNISAALNVDVVLGDYAVDLTLSGQRTELEHGEFDLDIKYAIPGSDAQRSFTVEYDTKTESLTAKNAEGVNLEIIEPETVEGEEVDEEAEVEIGKIMVGEEVAATILKRGSLVLIKYTDGVIESL